MIFPLYFHDQTTVPADTMIKRSILVQIRKMTQGESYVAEGGLGNGDIASVGEVSPTGEKLFQVYAPEKDDLYLKSYVSSDYVNGKWIASTVGSDPRKGFDRLLKKCHTTGAKHPGTKRWSEPVNLRSATTTRRRRPRC